MTTEMAGLLTCEIQIRLKRAVYRFQLTDRDYPLQSFRLFCASVRNWLFRCIFYTNGHAHGSIEKHLYLRVNP